MKKRLIEVKRYHVIRMNGKLWLLNEAHIGTPYNRPERLHFEYHRIYSDGRTNLKGYYIEDEEWIRNTMVEDLGEFYDWMKANHPVRYKRENWEASKPKPETIHIGETTPEDLRELCNAAACMYGHLIEFGVVMTGKEFADRIRRVYDCTDPHNAIYAQAVERVGRVFHNYQGIYMSMS